MIESKVMIIVIDLCLFKNCNVSTVVVGLTNKVCLWSLSVADRWLYCNGQFLSLVNYVQPALEGIALTPKDVVFRFVDVLQSRLVS